MTIKDVCAKYAIAPDTLRYYERVGVIPPVHRTQGGIREYDESDIGWVENAICLRSAGVPVESIIEYVRLFQQGNATLRQRRDLLADVRRELTEQKKQLEDALSRLDFKIGCYETAVKTGVLSFEKREEE